MYSNKSNGVTLALDGEPERSFPREHIDSQSRINQSFMSSTSGSFQEPIMAELLSDMMALRELNLIRYIMEEKTTMFVHRECGGKYST